MIPIGNLDLDTYSHFCKIMVVDNLLLDHVGLPQVLDLAVHLVNSFSHVTHGILLTVLLVQKIEIRTLHFGLRLWTKDFGLRTRDFGPKLVNTQKSVFHGEVKCHVMFVEIYHYLKRTGCLCSCASSVLSSVEFLLLV